MKPHFPPNHGLVALVASFLLNARWPRRHSRRTNNATGVPFKGMQQSHYVLQQYSNCDLSGDSGGDSES